MMKRLLLAEIALWLFAIIFSLQIGAGLYESCVVTPLWSNALPASVREFNRDERFAIKPRENFWRFCTPAVGASAFAAMLSGMLLPSDARRRRWILAATLPTLLMVLFTYLYFAPVSAEILARHGEGLSDRDLLLTARQWLTLSRIRAAIYVFSWLASLKALSVQEAAKSRFTARG